MATVKEATVIYIVVVRRSCWASAVFILVFSQRQAEDDQSKGEIFTYTYHEVGTLNSITHSLLFVFK